MKNRQYKIPLFILSDFIKETIEKTPTGGHYDKAWWSSRYTDLQVKKQMKESVWNSNPKLDFSFDELFSEVLIYYKNNNLALILLQEDYEND